MEGPAGSRSLSRRRHLRRSAVARPNRVRYLPGVGGRIGARAFFETSSARGRIRDVRRLTTPFTGALPSEVSSHNVQLHLLYAGSIILPSDPAYTPPSSFSAYFTPVRVVRALASIRAKEAQKRHNDHFFQHIGSAADRSPGPDDVCDLFPPRRRWGRASRAVRQARDPLALLARQAEFAVWDNMDEASRADRPWALRLHEFIAVLRRRVLTGDAIRLERPRIIPAEKDVAKHIYRPIANYMTSDRVLLSLVHGYLRDAFDPDFLDYSFAFRASRQHGRARSHHDAVEALRGFRKEHAGVPLWVGECDIQGFYDCVDHHVASLSFSSAADRAAARGVQVDRRATDVFAAYLRSYSFAEARLSASGALSRLHPEAKFKWPEEALTALNGGASLPRIGVPQGGALSCLIANLVLDEADRTVARIIGPNPRVGYYARYCDDILVATTDLGTTEAALAAYHGVLAALKLPAHPASDPPPAYGRGWWSKEHKSRAAYRWAGKHTASDAVPWVAFLGYQVRDDGLLRLRPAAIRKEALKQIEVADMALSALGVRSSTPRTPRPAHLTAGTIRVSKSQFLAKLRRRLISMSVGHATHIGEPAPHQLCWAVGFRLLHDGPIVRGQLRRLDRHRQRQIARVKRRIVGVGFREPKEDADMETRLAAARYLGRPYSYDGAFPQAGAALDALGGPSDIDQDPEPQES